MRTEKRIRLVEIQEAFLWEKLSSLEAACFGVRSQEIPFVMMSDGSRFLEECEGSWSAARCQGGVDDSSQEGKQMSSRHLEKERGDRVERAGGGSARF